MNSKVTLTFDGVLVNDNLFLGVSHVLTGVGSVPAIIANFVLIRTGSGQVALNSSASANILNAFNFVEAFNADYNNLNFYSVLRLGNVVELTINNSAYTFVTPNSASSISVDIENGTFIPGLNIDVSLSKKISEECDKVVVNATTSSQATLVTSPLNISPTTNPFSFDWVRGANFNLIVDGVTEKITTPPLMLPPTINALNSTSGATISIFPTLSPAPTLGAGGLIFSYSLDGLNWQPGNVFNGILEGTYTAYIKDNLDCVKSTSFEITAFTPLVTSLEAKVHISRSNPIILSKIEVWDNKSIYKNDTNTLSCSEDVLLPKKWTELVQTDDVDTIQIDSNFESVKAFIIDGETKNEITVVKRPNNLGRKDKRDANIYLKSNGKAGMYFTLGKTYNYDTGQDLNKDYFLNGVLPEWAEVGNFFFIDGIGHFEVKAITREKDKNALVIEFDFLASSSNVIVSSIYNAEDTETYEFDLIYAPYENKIIKLLVENDNPLEAAHFLSEDISVREIQKNTLEVRYWGSGNTDIDFSTGIRFKKRLLYDKFYNSFENEQELHITDERVVKTGSKNNRVKILNLTRLTTGAFNHLSEVFSNDNIIINGIRYQSKDIEPSEPIGTTNWYDCKIIFLDAGVDEQEFNYTKGSLSSLIIPKLTPFDSYFINLGGNNEEPILLKSGDSFITV